jgi:GTP-binding protein EngB required for normal cell division
MSRQTKSVNVSNLNNDKLQGVFDYTKAQFHNTNYAAPKMVKRSIYSDVSKDENEFNDKLQEVFDYTKAQFHNTNYTAPKMVKRSDYKSASMAENEFNDELQDWKKRNGENINASARQRFSEHLSQKYLCNRLDKLESSEIISRIRKGIVKKIDEIENPKTEDKDLFDNIKILFEEDSEEESSEEGEFEDCNTVNNEIPTDNINLCFVGGVSTGKSTVLNGVFCEELTQCKIKRTTMWPTVYVENEHIQDISTEEIYKIISEKNKEIIEMTESGKKIDSGDYKELVFNVGKLDINILENSYVNVYDIPGLNDARTKDIYYDYLDTNFHKFNLVVFMVDIHSGLNTSDEMDMLRFIINNTKDQFEKNNRNIYTLIIVNKADDMQTEEDSDKLEITGELREMFEQVENTVKEEFAKSGLKDNVIGIIPLCAIDAYLYRMVKKHGTRFKLSPEQILKIGVNENGKKFSMLKPATQEARVNEILKDNQFVDTMIKLSGFSRLESILNKFLKDNNKGSQLRIDNLMYELKKLPKLCDFTAGQSWFNLKSLTKLVEQYNKIYYNIALIDKTEYDAIMTSFTTEFTTILQDKVKRWYGTVDELIDSYDNVNTEIITPYIRQHKDYYNTTAYPGFLTERVLTLIGDELNTVLTVECIIKQLNILERINMFDKTTIETMFSKIVLNIRENKSIGFEEDGNRIDDLIEVLDKCSEIDVNLSELLRFLIMNQLHCINNNNSLFIKKMLYRRYGEIIISEYILREFNSSASAPFDKFVKGLTSEDLNSKEHKLDMYYLNYERQHNKYNFMYQGL